MSSPCTCAGNIKQYILVALDAVRPTNRPTDRCICIRCVDRQLRARAVSDSCSSTRTASKKLETFHVTMLRVQCDGCKRGFSNVEGLMNHLWDRDDSSPIKLLLVLLPVEHCALRCQKSVAKQHASSRRNLGKGCRSERGCIHLNFDKDISMLLRFR